MLDVLRYVLGTDCAPPRIDSIASFCAHARDLAKTFALPIDRAIAGGFAADRVGYAFAAGYQSALDALVPCDGVEPARDAVVRAFCATEQGGAHPRAIATRLEPMRGTGDYALHGKKRWATFAPVADVLLVVASLGTDAAGKNRLRVVRVGAALEGVSIHTMPATPFAPEIPHAEVVLDGVVMSASDVLEGDGYDVYVKPFRTVEDVHVLGALLGHVCAVARTYAWPHVLIEDIAFELAAVRALALLDATAPETHLALGAAFRALRALIARAEPEWSRVDTAVRARWERDLPLLDVAESVRAKRLDAAWRSVARENG